MPKRRTPGSGSVFEDRGHYRGSLTIGYDTQGRPKRVYVTGKSKRDVDSKLAKLKTDHEAGRLVVGPKLTVAQYLTWWLENVAKPRVRIRVYERYEEICRLHLSPTLGHLKLAKLSTAHLQELYAERVTVLSAATVHRVHTVLHTALHDACRLEMLGRNVAELAEPPRVEQRQMRSLTPEEAKRLIAALTDEPLAALYIVAISTGMRQGELFGLRWEDVDWTNGTLNLQQTIVQVRSGEMFVQAPKTRRGRRSVPLLPFAAEALRRHRAEQNAQRLALGDRWRDNDLVFTDGTGGPLRAQNVMRRSFVPLLERAGLPHIRFHDLRHSAASIMLALGVSLKTVQEILGHANIATTGDIYSHVMPVQQREALERLGDLLKPQ